MKFNYKFSAAEIRGCFASNAIWLPIWLIFGAVCCAINQFDFLWDFENYHFYNPWKFFDSENYEIYTPLATINSFFNPLTEAPLYFMVKYFNDFPVLIAAMQGLWFGGLIFMFHKTALLFFDKIT